MFVFFFFFFLPFLPVMNLILGGGITGLSVGWKLEERKLPYLIIEKETMPGGLCRSVHLEVKGRGFFHFDLAGHVLHLRHPEIKSRLAPFLKTCQEHQRRAWIYLADRLIPYPFQAHIAALPPRVAEECLIGFAKAWAHSPLPRRPGAEVDTQAGAHPPEEGPPASTTAFLSWSSRTFGEGITKYFMKPYNEKLWTVPLAQLTCDWMGRFVPRPSIEEIVQGFVSPQELAMGYNPTFSYPREGGIEGLVKWLRGRLVPRHLRTGVEVIQVEVERREVVLASGERQPYRTLYSTLPLPELIQRLSHAPAAVRRAGDQLKSNSVMVLYLALDHPVPADRHWVYVPEKKFPFYRVGFPSNLSPRNAPKGCGSLLVERAVSQGEPVDGESWSRQVIQYLVSVGWLPSEGSVLKSQVVRLPHAYIIYDRRRSAALKVIRAYLESRGIVSLGRYGAWEYCSIEDNILSGLSAAS